MKKLDAPVEEDREVPGKVSGTFFIHRKIHSIAEGPARRKSIEQGQAGLRSVVYKERPDEWESIWNLPDR